MDITYRSVKEHVARCCDGFVNKNYTVSTFSDLFDEMEEWVTDVPFVAGLRSLGAFAFTPEEQLALLLMCDHIIKKGMAPLDYEDYWRHPDFDRIQQGKEGLLCRGIIRRVGFTSDNADRTTNQAVRYMLSPWTSGMLFRGRKEVLSLEKLSKHTEIVVTANIEKKELIFNERNRDDVQRLFALFDPIRFTEIMNRLRERGRKASASCLLYGPPGTGKTELARQLALATGRDLVIADVAKLFASWHGDTEKNVKEMFETYQYLQSMSPIAPILLFNEADGLLSKRTDVMRQAVDKIENRVQNLLLQSLEDFEGIFIATTNMTGNLDPAFERRFLYKICLDVPDPDTRTSLWLSMVPDLDRQDARVLAEQYAFSGGQIDNVARKADIDIALFGGKVTLERMMNYCEAEKVGRTGPDFDKAFFNHGGTVS